MAEFATLQRSVNTGILHCVQDDDSTELEIPQIGSKWIQQGSFIFWLSFPKGNLRLFFLFPGLYTICKSLQVFNRNKCRTREYCCRMKASVIPAM